MIINLLKEFPVRKADQRIGLWQQGPQQGQKGSGQVLDYMNPLSNASLSNWNF